MTEQATAQLLPCPFCGGQICGGKKTLTIITGQQLMDEEQEFWPHSESFAVICDAQEPDGPGGCGAMGGFALSEQEAIEKWNRRSALQNAAQDKDAARYRYIVDEEDFAVCRWSPTTEFTGDWIPLHDPTRCIDAAMQTKE